MPRNDCRKIAKAMQNYLKNEEQEIINNLRKDMGAVNAQSTSNTQKTQKAPNKQIQPVLPDSCLLVCMCYGLYNKCIKTIVIFQS